MTAMDVILGLLHARPFTGYEIKHAFQAQFSYFFDASFGTIYPTLGKMEQLGYITKESIPQDNRPVKHVYSLTDKGREQFKNYLDSPLEAEAFRSDFLVRLVFGEHQKPDIVIRMIEDNIQAVRAKLSDLEEKKRLFCDGMSQTRQIVLNMGIETSKARLRVLEEGLSMLKANVAGDRRSGSERV
ncbi:PadR family transcriptional regulator [Cohnella sp. CFH 77786]|uniref:PadR family transcriptional regulator n=1 Tax=Cohnella sp. CFH 77786 TaxID=2662265 RepID=UPI001C60C95A|nr:PadR family transcriptional regulator [Cohnella sp. CFH 77786]